MRHDVPNLEIYRLDPDDELLLPLLGPYVRAGFPSPADDFLEGDIDLKALLTLHPEATFMGRVRGDSLKDMGIHEGDVLIVDKLLRPDFSELRDRIRKNVTYRREPQLVVCWLDGGYTVKHIKLFPKHALLLSANEAYEPIVVTEQNELILWGVVTWVLKKTY